MDAGGPAGKAPAAAFISSPASSRPDPPVAPTLREAIAEFLRHVQWERRLSPNTVRAYTHDCYDFCDRTERRLGRPAEINDFVRPHLRAQLGELFPRSAATVSRCVAALRTFGSFCCRQGWLRDNPARSLRSPRVVARLPVVPSERDAQLLVEGPVRQGWLELRDRALLEVLYGAGVRVAEACGMTVHDVRFEGDEATLRVIGKGDRERVAVVGRPGATALRAWLVARAEEFPALTASAALSSSLFLGVAGSPLSTRSARDVVYSRSMFLLGRRLGPHKLRHACATHMLLRGADIRHIAEILGHLTLRSTQVYTDLDIRDLEAIYTRCHPRSS